MKTYIFFTNDGISYDGAGDEVENAHVLGWASGDDALDAYNKLLESESISGLYDSCYCQELVSETTCSFDLVNYTDESED